MSHSSDDDADEKQKQQQPPTTPDPTVPAPRVTVKASDILGREIRPEDDDGSGDAFAREHAALEYDLGCLAAFDAAPVDAVRVSTAEGASAFAEESTLAAMRGLVAQLWELPAADDHEDGGRVADLPLPITSLPREKPLPVAPPPTRWQTFAQRKGIVKGKRSRMVWSEEAQDWLPRYGLGSAKKRAAADDWIIEDQEDISPAGGNPAARKKSKRLPEDPFEAREMQKSLAVQRQKKNQLRNAKKAKRAAAAHLGAIDVDARAGPTLQAMQQPPRMKGKKKRGSAAVTSAIRAAKVSTASMGKFDEQHEATRTVKAAKLRHKGRGFPQ